MQRENHSSIFLCKDLFLHQCLCCGIVNFLSSVIRNTETFSLSGPILRSTLQHTGVNLNVFSNRGQQRFRVVVNVVITGIHGAGSSRLLGPVDAGAKS